MPDDRPRYEILLVDDDLLVRHVIADEIEEAGHLVITAANGDTALMMLKANPSFDLVLVDYAMPGMGGKELVRRIRAEWPDMKIAFLTGYAEILSRNQEETCPILAKGTMMDELIKGIEAVARGEPVQFDHDATSARVDRLLEQISTRPAVEGIQRQLQSIYERTLQDSLPQPLARLIDRLNDSGPSDTQK
ncbi:MAG TPA: response regulator [Beijerinckia sp.]|nr:response regulator [Beijerinckia sp.]